MQQLTSEPATRPVQGTTWAQYRAEVLVEVAKGSGVVGRGVEGQRAVRQVDTSKAEAFPSLFLALMAHGFSGL